MKKIFMTLAAVAVAATMNAQVYLGGAFGLGFENKLIDKAGWYTLDGRRLTGEPATKGLYIRRSATGQSRVTLVP